MFNSYNQDLKNTPQEKIHQDIKMNMLSNSKLLRIVKLSFSYHREKKH